MYFVMPLKCTPSMVSGAAGRHDLHFDDVQLVPQHPPCCSIGGREHAATRRTPLNVPIVSAGMDHRHGIAPGTRMAQPGGLGVSHKNWRSPSRPRSGPVKRSESGMIVDPITLSPTHRIFEALDLMKKYRISGVPITEDGSKEGRLVGILTNRDLRFETNVQRPIADIMTREHLITVPVGTTLDAAREILHQHKVEKLLASIGNPLEGLITVKTSKGREVSEASKACSPLRCGAL